MKTRTTSLQICLALAMLAAARTGRAGGFEIPDNGTEALGRGGAFVAKADDPTAIDYNPAGLAGQRGTRVLVDGHIINSSYSFKRFGAFPDNPSESGDAVGRLRVPLRARHGRPVLRALPRGHDGLRHARLADGGRRRLRPERRRQPDVPGRDRHGPRGIALRRRAAHLDDHPADAGRGREAARLARRGAQPAPRRRPLRPLEHVVRRPRRRLGRTLQELRVPPVRLALEPPRHGHRLRRHSRRAAQADARA